MLHDDLSICFQRRFYGPLEADVSFNFPLSQAGITSNASTALPQP